MIIYMYISELTILILINRSKVYINNSNYSDNYDSVVVVFVDVVVFDDGDDDDDEDDESDHTLCYILEVILSVSIVSL